MDLSGFVRRFSQSSVDVRQLPNKPPQGLTVDTAKANAMLKDLPPQWTGSSPINILSGMRNMRNSTSSINTDNNASESPPGSGRTSESATPTSARSSFSGSSDNNNNNNNSSYNEQMMRRRRSNSECLMLAKSRGGADLPGPCKEYIAGVKQILARSEESSQPALLRRRRSMSLNRPPLGQ